MGKCKVMCAMWSGAWHDCVGACFEACSANHVSWRAEKLARLLSCEVEPESQLVETRSCCGVVLERRLVRASDLQGWGVPRIGIRDDCASIEGIWVLNSLWDGRIWRNGLL